MGNVPIIGRVYHVVDKISGEVVKVGSTIYSLEKRFNAEYRRKYSNHYLKEFKILQSSDLDYYDPEDSYCPFLWHLAASEHMEMLRSDTFRKNRYSNLVSPLDQKFCGFDGTIGGQIGGAISGRRNAESGHMSRVGKSGAGPRKAHELHPEMAKEIGKRNAERMTILGRKNAESGWLDKIRDREANSRFAKIQGRKNVESGHMERMRQKLAEMDPQVLLAMRRAACAKGREAYVRLQSWKKVLTLDHQKRASHTRWHVRRGIISSTCSLCMEKS